MSETPATTAAPATTTTTEETQPAATAEQAGTTTAGREFDFKEVTLGSLAKNTALYVSTTTKLEEAMKIMKNHKFSSIPVYDKAKKEFVGTLDYFAIMAYVAFGEFKKALVQSDLASITFEKQLVGELVALSKEGNRVWVFEPTDNLETILEPMSKGVHRVTVNKKKGQKRAVITQRDVIEYLNKWIDSQKSFGRKYDLFTKKIGELSLGKTPAVTVPMATTAIDAFQKMYKEDISSLGIVDESGSLVANLSVTDLRWLNHDQKLPAIFLPVMLFLHEVHGENQPRKPVVVDDTATLPVVVARLVETRVKRVWVIDGPGKPTGVITLTDVISKFCSVDVTLLN